MKREIIVQLCVACLNQAVGKFGTLYVFPILPSITQDFFPLLSESQLGYKQGYLAGIYFFGNFFGNLFWGRMADKFGRKKAMMASTFLYSLSVVMFGLSLSFPMALLMRFLWGFFNGLDTIIKTFIAELCATRDEMARGLALHGMADGIGRMIGPTISAWLSRPADKFQFLDNFLFRRFPYFLPSLVCYVLAILTILVSHVFIRETLPRKQDLPPGVNNNNRQTNNHICKLLSQRLVLTAILNYNLFAFINIEFEELVPLMLVTAPAYGGFCMNENSLGLISLSTSALMFPWSLLAIPVLLAKLGVKWCIRALMVVYTSVVFLVPLWTKNSLVRNSFAFIVSSSSNTTTTTTTTFTSCNSISLGISSVPFGVWFLLLSLLVPLYLLRCGLFTCYTIGVANSTTRDTRATVNGWSQAGASLVRLVGPILSANVFAWSISTGKSWPMDFSLIWLIGCLQLFVLFLASFTFPPEIEHSQD